MSDGAGYRELVRSDLLAVPTFREAYSLWRPEIERYSNNFKDAEKVLELGSNLREIFLSTRGDGRSSDSGQSAVAKAGVAWECLVVWYLNLIFHGSRGIATRKSGKLVPKCVLDAISITYGSFQTNSESDVIVMCLPKEMEGEAWTKLGRVDEEFFRSNIHRLKVGVIQCKTNWNENAQIPMLWDMVYKLAGSQGNLSVGKNGYSAKDFRGFTYSFVTAPTQTESRMPGPRNLPAKRVRNLSGGNFWGRPTQDDVALSFKEIFTRNFAEAFDANVAASVGTGLECGNPFILDL